MNDPKFPASPNLDSSRNIDNLSRSVAGALILLRSPLLETSETAALDASVLLAHLLGKSRGWVLAHPEAALNQEQINELKSYLVRLEHQEPLPYLLGHWEFYWLDFELTPDVLIPRPETELLVEQALTWLQIPEGRKNQWVADIGTGSGCIAVTLAAYQPLLKVLASDLSFPALQVARRNARKHYVDRQIDFLQADLLTPFSTHEKPVFDLICANLPYIPTQALHKLPVFRHEPALALDGGTSGLVYIERLLDQAASCLSPGGLLLAEIEASQGPAASARASDAFPGARTEILKDLEGHDRLLRVDLIYP